MNEISANTTPEPIQLKPNVEFQRLANIFQEEYTRLYQAGTHPYNAGIRLADVARKYVK